jgi:hypothetical protein
MLKMVLTDEFAHVKNKSPYHDDKWRSRCVELCGSVPDHNSNCDNLLNEIQEYTKPCNVGNVTGIQNILLDYHLLQAYRKFSKKVLATEGHWEVKGDNMIRLFPTPRGSFPCMIEYYPTVNRFRTPAAKEITKRALVAEAKIILGNTRSKFGGIPSPDGGTFNTNGSELRIEGQTEKAQAVQDAILLGEPLPILLYLIPLIISILPLLQSVFSTSC